MIDYEFIQAIIYDGLFAAVAAIGFAIISNPPRKALAISAFLAAVGHGLRYFLLHTEMFTMDIATASFCAAVSIGLLAIPFAKFIHCPAEVFSFPSLLPMIPGMFAGYLQEMVGYEWFFWIVMLCCIATVVMTMLVRRRVDATYGKKHSGAEKAA